MLGAIIGDIIGSRFEKHNIKSKQFELFTRGSKFTDDTVLTVAVADAILNNHDYEKTIKNYARRYPFAGYGGTFKKWMLGIIKGPYNSWGNGSAMRVSPVGFAFESIETLLAQAQKSAFITHNHPEGIAGAQAIAIAIYLARTGKSKNDIKEQIEKMFHYDLSRNLDSIREHYVFDVSCRGSVPESILVFLESTDFEDAIRTAISIGGDSDTIACMAGGIAQAYYREIPRNMIDQAYAKLPLKFIQIIELFNSKYLQ
ncbi:MAG: ADP-ribosylglycohydrolase family protein [Lewinellaceae bacterium]|nr:ADP-ribosylglycohydrolase family protein [Lewinellaceae bacterium]MCB9331283.1 ADP-ribosylglycohydrolase family protein [Lewinellaceae bacterium]